MRRIVRSLGVLALATLATRAQAIDADFRGLAAVSDTVAWVSGTKGTVARTTDGGKTWKRLPVPGAEALDFRDVEAFGESTAYALSIGPGESSRIYKTVDGGTTWKMQFQNTEKDAFYDAIAFWDATHGLAMSDPVDGRYRLLATNDGTTWTVLKPETMPAALEGEGAFAASGTCLIVRGERDAWFVTGGAKQARVFHTTDRGKNWTVAELPIAGGVPSAGAFSIAFRDAKHGLVVGGDYKTPNATGATAAITRDSGKTWTAVKDALPFRSCVVWAKDRWVAVGTSGRHSSVDGMTWKELDGGKWNAAGATKDGAVWLAGPKGQLKMLGK
ncbi:MAG: glycosyl hydrolase [Gemmataceae bacterium]|nr:glycosyl hydrolase [Gemmataceae bacterium]